MTCWFIDIHSMTRLDMRWWSGHPRDESQGFSKHRTFVSSFSEESGNFLHHAYHICCLGFRFCWPFKWARLCGTCMHTCQVETHKTVEEQLWNQKSSTSPDSEKSRISHLHFGVKSFKGVTFENVSIMLPTIGCSKFLDPKNYHK